MGKLFDQAIGKDVHVVLESSDDGHLDVRVSYPVQKLQAPIEAFLTKYTAKVPFIQRYIPFAMTSLFARFGGVSNAPVVNDAAPAPAELPADNGPAAHEAAPIEPAAPQV